MNTFKLFRIILLKIMEEICGFLHRRRRGTISLTIGLDSKFEIPLYHPDASRERGFLRVRDSPPSLRQTFDKFLSDSSVLYRYVHTYDESFPFLGYPQINNCRPTFYCVNHQSISALTYSPHLHLAGYFRTFPGNSGSFVTDVTLRYCESRFEDDIACSAFPWGEKRSYEIGSV